MPGFVTMTGQPIRKTAAFAGIVLLVTAIYAGGATYGLLSDTETSDLLIQAGNTGTTVGNEQVYDGDGVCTGNVGNTGCDGGTTSARLIGPGILSLHVGVSRNEASAVRRS